VLNSFGRFVMFIKIDVPVWSIVLATRLLRNRPNDAKELKNDE